MRLFGEVVAPGKYLPYAVRGFFDNGGRRMFVARIVGANAVAAQAQLSGLVIKAVGGGLWGHRIFVKIGPGSVLNKDGNSIGFKLQIAYWDSFPGGGAPFDAFDNRDQLPRPALVEEYDDLGIEPASPDYFGKRVNNRNSALIEIEEPAPPLAALPAAGFATLGGGTDGDPINNVAFGGEEIDPEKRRGLAALKLDKYREVAIVHAPAADPPTVAGRHHPLRAEPVPVPQSSIRRPTSLTRQRLNRATTTTPSTAPSTILGSLSVIRGPAPRPRCRPAATSPDLRANGQERGVFKAPANELVRGALELEFDTDQVRKS